MPSRSDKTILDYVVIAINPALIMLLVGSLVFFLLTVFYHSQFEGRLHFIFAMFVLATVLIARIAMNEGTEYAMLFAMPLALAAGLAMLRFVSIEGPLGASPSPLINFGLLGIVWWSAHKLTWDCTLIDEQEDASGQGLLQTIGLDDDPRADTGAPIDREPTAEASPRTTSAESADVWWRGRWQRFVEHQRRPHAPGVWVVYFSLAALPLFGLGQRLIPAADAANRQYAFRLLFVYVASALALLLTTSFLGLRRYLRQRQVSMSVDMARNWLITGGVLILLLLVLCTLLPRPSAEYSVSRLPLRFGSPESLRASDDAPGRDGPRDDRPRAKPARVDKDDQPTDRPKAEGQQKSETFSRQSPADDGPQDQKRPPRRQTDPSPTADPSSDGPSEDDSRPQRAPQGPGSPEDPPPSDGETFRENHSQSRADHPDRPLQREPAPDEPSRDQEAGPPESDPRTQSGSSPSRDPHRLSASRPPPAVRPGQLLTTLGSTMAGILKLVFYVAVLAVVGFLLWQNADRVRSAWLRFLDELRQFWSRLFGHRPDSSAPPDHEVTTAAPKPRPFADFADPFATGLAGRFSATELIKYSFEALEAWAREHGCPRAPDQTPHEFAQHVATHQRSLGTDAHNLALLYSRAAYARGSLPASTTQQLKNLWSQLRGNAPMIW